MATEAVSHGLSIDPRSLVIYIVNFGILLFLMERFVVRKLLKVIDDRRAKIHDNLEAVEKLRSDFAREVAEKEEMAQREMSEMRDRSVRLEQDTKREVETMLREATENRERLMKETERQIASMEQEAMRAVSAEAKGRVAKAVALVLGQEVEGEAIDRSVKTAFSDLSSGKSR